MNTEEFEKQLKQLLQEKKNDEIPRLLSKSSDHFWAEVYPKKSKEEKIIYWAGSFHTDMRQQWEFGRDELDTFSRSDYEACKTKEPDFDELLPEIIKKLKIKPEKVYNRFKE